LVPRTVKLSERFYQKFGHELVDEMVNWFNDTDSSYRAELRELNDLNFARFDAKLEQRLGDQRAELIKWMFVFWIGNFATTAGLMVALVHLTHP
jgi:hypothetical protein